MRQGLATCIQNGEFKFDMNEWAAQCDFDRFRLLVEHMPSEFFSSFHECPDLLKMPNINSLIAVLPKWILRFDYLRLIVGCHDGWLKWRRRRLKRDNENDKKKMYIISLGLSHGVINDVVFQVLPAIEAYSFSMETKRKKKNVITAERSERKTKR